MTESDRQQVEVLQRKLQELQERSDNLKRELIQREQQTRAAIEARDAAHAEERKKWEHELNQRVTKFVEEREQWLRTIKGRETELESLRHQLSEKDHQVHAVMEEKEQRLREAMTRLENEVRDRERRVWMEKETLTKQHDTQLATRESQFRSAMEKKDAELKEAREHLLREVRELRAAFEEERKAFEARLVAKDQELVGIRGEEATKIGEVQVVWHRRHEELQMEIDRLTAMQKERDELAMRAQEQMVRQHRSDLELKTWEASQAVAKLEQEQQARVERLQSQWRELEHAFSDERARWIPERTKDLEAARQEVETGLRSELRAALDRKDRERDEAMIVSEQRIKDAERRVWEERDALKLMYEEQLASQRLSSMETLKRKEEEWLVAKERYEGHARERTVVFEAERKAWLENLKRKEDDLSATKAASMAELGEVRSRADVKEAELKASIKREGEAVALKKDKEFHETIDSLRKEREQLIHLYEERLRARELEGHATLEGERRNTHEQEARWQGELKLASGKLEEERRASLEMLQGKDNETLSVKSELVQKISAHRRQLEEKESVIHELQLTVDREVKERDQRLWNEREAMAKQFEERLLKREAELKAAIREREQTLKETQERFHHELRMLTKRLEEERESWHDTAKARDREGVKVKEELLARVASLHVMVEKRDADIAELKDRQDAATRDVMKPLRAELEEKERMIRALDDEVSRFTIELALRESQAKALVDRTELETKAVKEEAERELRLLHKRFDAEKASWMKALKSREQEGQASKRELYIRQILSS